MPQVFWTGFSLHQKAGHGTVRCMRAADLPYLKSGGVEVVHAFCHWRGLLVLSLLGLLVAIHGTCALCCSLPLSTPRCRTCSATLPPHILCSRPLRTFHSVLQASHAVTPSTRPSTTP